MQTTNIRVKVSTRDALKDYKEAHDLHSLDSAILLALYKAKANETIELKGVVEN